MRDFETVDETGAEEQWERQTAARLASARRAGEAVDKLRSARAHKQQPSKSSPRD